MLLLYDIGKKCNKYICISPYINSFMTEVPIIQKQAQWFHSIDLLCKSMDWFLYDRVLRHERVNV